MTRSTTRILTTHAGSLPRPSELVKFIKAKTNGEKIDETAFKKFLAQAVIEIVRKQVEIGIDIVNDGEFSKASFLTYVTDRLSGYEARPGAAPTVAQNSREAIEFPDFYLPSATRKRPRIVCAGPISYIGQKQIARDIENLKGAASKAGAREAFMTAIAPSNVELSLPNEYYKTSDEYLRAIADAMRNEYVAIIEAGLTLQIDDPYLVTYYVTKPDLTVAQCRSWAESRVSVLNYALRDLPQERIRFHTCYSINMGPRIHDMQLKDIADIILSVNAGAYSFEAANPRHEHEWRLWKDISLAAGKKLIPGVITNSTVLVEHEEVVADRLRRFAEVAGSDNLVAGADCGFSSFAGSDEFPASIVWAKMKSLVAGARLVLQ